MEKLIKVAVMAAAGWLVGEIAADTFEALGVPKRAAVIVGGVIGGLI